jgi:hypothetical protein
MAPEQASGGKVSVRSDIYSLGLVLYEIFTGSRAFADGKRGALESPASLVKDLDPDVERIIFRCLAEDPEDRPATAMAVAAALPGGDPLQLALAAGQTPPPEMVAASGVEERSEIRQHLDGCEACREELQRYRKLSVLLSRVPRAVPPVDLAIRIKVAASQAQETQGWPRRWQRIKDRAEILVDNVFRPLTVPATGGLFSALVIFAFVLHLILPGITVKADPNDIPTGLLRPAELIALSNYPETFVAEVQHPDVDVQHDLLVDVTVDVQGQMVDYDILAGPDSPQLRHQLDQMLIFSRFRPMLSFGRPIAGGHVVLSFSAVHVRG